MLNIDFVTLIPLIVAILTSIVTIIVTLVSNKNTRIISKDAIIQQEKIFHRTSKLDYLNQKIKFLEKQLLKINDAKTHKSLKNLTWGNEIQETFRSFNEQRKIIDETRHYLDDSEIAEFIEFTTRIQKLLGTIRQTAISKKFDENQDEIINEIGNISSKVPEMIEFSSTIIQRELKNAVKKVNSITET